jgi:hypothetical protein
VTLFMSLDAFSRFIHVKVFGFVQFAMVLDWSCTYNCSDFAVVTLPESLSVELGLHEAACKPMCCMVSSNQCGVHVMSLHVCSRAC